MRRPLLAAVFAIHLATAAPAQILPNPDFESPGESGDAPAFWFAGRVGIPPELLQLAWDDRVAHSGHRSVAIGFAPDFPSDRADMQFNWTNTIEGFEIGAAYEITAWIRSRGLGTSPTILVQCQDSGRESLAQVTTHREFPVLGDSEWTQVRATFTVPEGTAFVRVRALLVPRGNRGGRAWFDDFHVAKLPRPASPGAGRGEPERR